MSAVAQDAEKVAVDEGYLEHFARQALRAPKGEQEDAVRKLVESLIAKCQENAVFFEDQMKGLALLGQLNDVLGSIVIANLITERFDGQVSQERKKKPLRSFFFALAGSLQAMEAMCVNYGVCSALVLTMTFANFGAIGKGDWDAYMVLFSSWLYIAIYATKVNRNRWSEVRKLTKRLSGEFLLLQVTFLLGIIFAGFGIGAVMTIKVTDEDMSWVTFLLSVAMMLLMVYMLFQIIREVLMINRFGDKVRKERTEKFSSETEKTLVEEMGK